MKKSRGPMRYVGLALLVSAAGVAAWGAWPSSAAFDVEAFSRGLDARLGEAGAGLHTRVSTLAELPRLAVAVATDPRTVADLTQDELAFRPHPGETIAIAQIPKRSGKGPVLLLLAPRGATRPALDIVGRRLQVVGASLVATEAVRVAPRERANEVDGVIAVSWVVDLGPLSASLTAAGVQAQIASKSGVLTLGASTPPPGAVRQEVRLAGLGDGVQPADVAVGVLASPSLRALPTTYLWGGAIVLALVGAALLGWGRGNAIVDKPGTIWNAGVPVRSSNPRVTGITGPITGPSAHPTPVGVPEMVIGRIGRYELLRKIGVGGMAEVYLARSTGEAGFAKLVALKVLLPDFASRPQVVEHFLDEARLAAQLYHPNIVQTVDLGRAGDDYFMAMEFIDGADLLRLIDLSQARRKPVPVNVALAILRGICAGLQAAHAACEPDGQPLDLVHRDVKSANVFVARTGVVKVGDFGIARANHAGWVRRTENGMVKGTPGYMAPEQRLGQPIDGRADMYGVGAIAYELLTGQPVNLDLALLAAKGREGWPHLPPLSSVRWDVPKELEAIVMRTLAFDKEDRFQTCDLLEQALEAVAVAHPPIAGDKAIAKWFEDLVTGGPRLVEPTSHASVALGR